MAYACQTMKYAGAEKASEVDELRTMRPRMMDDQATDVEEKPTELDEQENCSLAAWIHQLAEDKLAAEDRSSW